ncbi:MAG: MTH1187 family thiamine-binding protein [Actinomycetaceae bacterium]|nr:MTH1187 family thiamine-binding protein [Actinomycetaceae bacterium]MDY6083476.1 MTH1187 family thiamine-binding protein [Actinomycetaceae bacterium]
MNVLIALAIAPFGEGEELASYVADAVRVIQESGLAYETHSMFTEIEGEWDDVMACVKKATEALTDRGIRTEVLIKADIRPGYTDMMHGKIQRLNNHLQQAV